MIDFTPEPAVLSVALRVTVTSCFVHVPPVYVLLSVFFADAVLVGAVESALWKWA